MAQIRLLIPHDRRLPSRWWRTLRAIYRDSMALWREFRRPILIFLITTIGGGLLYNELLALAGYPRQPLYTLPYMMMMLMLFQAPGTPPAEPYLIAFWYLLPLVAVYAIGQGAVDFARLFFNRAERRNAWEEAVASTYRNHVIILGIGHLGQRVTRALVQMGFEVVAIDNSIDDDADKELSELGVPLITADGRLPSTLETAGLRYAQALIVCTANDYLNLEVTMRARDLNPDVRVVVRLWESQFAEPIHRFMNVEVLMSTSDLAAPAFAGSAVGIEIAQTLMINGVEYSMIKLKVNRGSFMEGESIERIQNNWATDIVLHEHGESVQVHPSVKNVLKAGDTVVMFAQHNKITDIVAHNRRQG